MEWLNENYVWILCGLFGGLIGWFLSKRDKAKFMKGKKRKFE